MLTSPISAICILRNHFEKNSGFKAFCNNSTEVIDTEEEKREQQMDKRVQNLLSLFPQKDPEYLRTKNNEFGLDLAGVTAFEAWVLEVVENGGKDLPSREDYDKRKKVKQCNRVYLHYF